MTPSTEFRLEPLAGNELRSRLISSDGRLSEPVEGRVLEAEFQTPAGVLAITSDDNPYEEVLHFTLLNKELQVLDALSLGQMYHPGILRDLHVTGESALQFRFFGEDNWRLTVLPQPRFLLPSLLGSVKRRAWLRSSFLLLERL